MHGSTTNRIRRFAMTATLLMMAACSTDADELDGSSAATTTEPVANSATPAPDTSPVVTTPQTAATTSATTPATTPATTEPAPTAASTTPAEIGIDPQVLVATLADDAMQGRDNATDGSVAAQETLIAVMSTFAMPWDATGGDGYRQAFAGGSNVIGIIPGSDLADEYVMIGAHYDHLGRGDCRLVTAADDICNGAVDNATGVAAAMAIGEAIAAEAPRRSVVIAFWDAEEDGLLGSRAFVATPVIPLDSIVTYVNFDMQGSDLLPSLADRTIAVGAETGGEALAALVEQVTDASPLDYAVLSLIMGQGRSDHAPFAAAGVPVTFFTDATNGCYHSALDDIDAVDVDKLRAQTATATELVRRLANDDLSIEFVADAPTTRFSDAERLLDLARTGESDLASVDVATADAARSVIERLDAVVTAGAGAYDGAAEAATLGAAAGLVDLLADTHCSLGMPG